MLLFNQLPLQESFVPKLPQNPTLKHKNAREHKSGEKSPPQQNFSPEQTPRGLMGIFGHKIAQKIKISVQSNKEPEEQNKNKKRKIIT